MAIGNSLLNISVGVLGGEQAIRIIGDLGNVAVDTAVKSDKMAASMEAASGSSVAASENLAFVTQISKQMGAELYSSADAFMKLTAATKDTSLEGEQTKLMFEALVAANTKLGGSTADLSGMLNAFTQMISKGTVSMEELRGQFGERLPGAMKLAADALGMTTAELIDHVSKGEVLAEDLLPKLSEAISKTYNDGKFDTAAANINRLSNSWEEFKQHVVDSSWVNSVLKSMDSFMQGINIRYAGLNAQQAGTNIIELRKQLETYQNDWMDRAIKPAGWKEKTEQLLKENQEVIRQHQLKVIDSWDKTHEDESIGARTYARQVEADLIKSETDKIKIIENKAKEALDVQNKLRDKALRDAAGNIEQEKIVNTAYAKWLADHERDKAEKIKQIQDKLDAPGKRAGARAEKKEERDAARSQREYESMVERSRDLIASLENDYLTYTGKTFADSIKKIDALAEAQKKAEQDKVINAKLTGEQLIAANEQLAKVNAAIDAKAAADKEEIAKKAIEKIKDYENDLAMDIAKLNNDRLTQVRLIYEAQTKANKKELDKQVVDAKNSQQQIAAAERLYEQRQILLDKKYNDDRVRISGSYLDKLSLKMRETYSSETSIVDEFNTNMVDLTMNAANGIADSFAQMAVSGKASWADLANSIILEIEKMIAKMMIMYAVQQLVGMAGGMIGGEAGGLMSASVGGSPFNGSGMFSSFANANGNAFDGGNVIPFANGGVVDKPVLFPMAKGTGLMGEAGPEAIMPLTRDGSGRLGVKSHGGNGGGGISIGSINVQVPASKDPEKQGQMIGSAIERQIKQLVQLQVKDSFRPGNTMNPSKTIGGGVVQS
jgi:lambda family phage tail tape measure protein